MKLIILGSGTSTGVPRVGNDWGACDPNEPKNRRTRVSIVVESDDCKRLLVDTSTDLRFQLLQNEITALDGAFWTHDHADHCHGIDDLRALRFGRNGPIPGFASEQTAFKLRQRFGYIFAGQFGYPSIATLNTLEQLKMHAGFVVRSCEMPHGPGNSTGYRFECDGKSIAYLTDFSEITSDMKELCEGVDILVSDCLRRAPHPTHANLAMALELAQVTSAKILILSHLDKSMDYETLSKQTPDNVLLAFAGMEIFA
mgnify:FL=1